MATFLLVVEVLFHCAHLAGLEIFCSIGVGIKGYPDIFMPQNRGKRLQIHSGFVHSRCKGMPQHMVVYMWEFLYPVNVFFAFYLLVDLQVDPIEFVIQASIVENISVFGKAMTVLQPNPFP